MRAQCRQAYSVGCIIAVIETYELTWAGTSRWQLRRRNEGHRSPRPESLPQFAACTIYSVLCQHDAAQESSLEVRGSILLTESI